MPDAGLCRCVQSKVSNSARHSDIRVNSCHCLNNPVLYCHAFSPCRRDYAFFFFLFSTDVPCRHSLHNQAVTDTPAGTWAKHTGHSQSNHKSCRTCHLNSRAITCHLSNMAVGVERQPRSDKIKSLTNKFNCSPLICGGGLKKAQLKFTGTLQQPLRFTVILNDLAKSEPKGALQHTANSRRFIQGMGILLNPSNAFVAMKNIKAS